MPVGSSGYHASAGNGDTGRKRSGRHFVKSSIPDEALRELEGRQKAGAGDGREGGNGREAASGAVKGGKKEAGTRTKEKRKPATGKAAGGGPGSGAKKPPAPGRSRAFVVTDIMVFIILIGASALVAAQLFTSDDDGGESDSELEGVAARALTSFLGTTIDEASYDSPDGVTTTYRERTAASLIAEDARLRGLGDDVDTHELGAGLEFELHNALADELGPGYGFRLEVSRDGLPVFDLGTPEAGADGGASDAVILPDGDDEPLTVTLTIRGDGA